MGKKRRTGFKQDGECKKEKLKEKDSLNSKEKTEKVKRRNEKRDNRAKSKVDESNLKKIVFLSSLFVAILATLPCLYINSQWFITSHDASFRIVEKFETRDLTSKSQNEDQQEKEEISLPRSSDNAEDMKNQIFNDMRPEESRSEKFEQFLETPDATVKEDRLDHEKIDTTIHSIVSVANEKFYPTEADLKDVKTESIRTFEPNEEEELKPLIKEELFIEHIDLEKDSLGKDVVGTSNDREEEGNRIDEDVQIPTDIKREAGLARGETEVSKPDIQTIIPSKGKEEISAEANKSVTEEEEPKGDQRHEVIEQEEEELNITEINQETSGKMEQVEELISSHIDGSIPNNNAEDTPSSIDTTGHEVKEKQVKEKLEVSVEHGDNVDNVQKLNQEIAEIEPSEGKMDILEHVGDLGEPVDSATDFSEDTDSKSIELNEEHDKYEAPTNMKGVQVDDISENSHDNILETKVNIKQQVQQNMVVENSLDVKEVQADDVSMEGKNVVLKEGKTFKSEMLNNIDQETLDSTTLIEDSSTADDGVEYKVEYNDKVKASNKEVENNEKEAEKTNFAEKEPILTEQNDIIHEKLFSEEMGKIEINEELQKPSNDIETKINQPQQSLEMLLEDEVEDDETTDEDDQLEQMSYGVEVEGYEVIKEYTSPVPSDDGLSEKGYHEVSKGVSKKIIQEGTGNIVEKGDLITIHCLGFVDGIPRKKFWSTKDPAQKPFTFAVGKREVMKGWDEGAETMKLNEYSIFRIEPRKAYGRFGFKAWNTIPPNSRLILEIEVIRVQKAKDR